ncbi:DNA-entry nuclease [Streptococcus danieliae]|uniref:DNA-entry nuclease n=1 Tax=Streptococcus danieliae TaxID=747656 RepID=A0A7X3G8G4_9STRE|nr:DNA-entry nuclease [Streptococcus danieliae]
MKKHKFLLVSICFLLILLAQPQNFIFLRNLFTYQNLASQLNLSDSPEEKNSGSDSAHQRQNEDLKSKVFDGQNQVLVVNEVAQFRTEDLSLENGSWEKYSDLDSLNRVGVAEAMLGQELMPTSDREDISSVIPTGWKNKRIVFNGKQDYLYNRSHLIAFQLGAENANVRNLFTGTRALNANFEDEKSSMVYYENSIANYIVE